MSTPHNEKTYSLKNLYLDPNNYRFLDKNEYAKSSDEQAIEKIVQTRTFDLLRGRNNSSIADLIASFIQNGYLPVDQIQVRKIAHQKYLVIEGNRRVAALKVLEQMYNDAKDIGKLTPQFFKKVPVVDYEGNDPSKFKILMGLKHISGNKKWPAINQAKLLASLLDEHDMSESDIYKSLGISKIEMRATRRTLSLIKKYEDSDFGDQFASEKYSTFREIIKSPRLKEWLELSPNDIELMNVHENNLYRLFSWISITEEEFSDEDIESEETHVIHQEPIIETALQIRELAKIISDPKALSNLETTRSLVDATLSSETLGKNKLENSLTLIREQINSAFNYTYLIDDEKVDIISESIRKMQALLVTRNTSSLDSNDSYFNKKPIVESCSKHFTKLSILNYKKFENLVIENLNTVNIIAGINNAGKSTILEAIYMLTELGDTKTIQAINRFRRKYHGESRTHILYEELPEEVSLSATFNSELIQLDSSKTTESEIDNQTDFIGKITSICKYMGNSYSYNSDYFNKDIRHYATTNNTLCNSIISYSSGVDEHIVFKECYQKAVRNGAKKRVIDFIQVNIDKDMIDIELSDSDGTFVVVYDDPSMNKTLSQYGDGLQKIFYLGIKFAACSNGVLLLDEIENGIHKDLLIKFTQLIQQLAEAYKVQVFVTSHSKECIDAFIENKYNNDQISAFAVDSNENTIDHFSGDELAELIDYINLDIRGGN